MGFIAQEVQKASPDLVHEDADTGILSLNTTGTNSLLQVAGNRVITLFRIYCVFSGSDKDA